MSVPAKEKTRKTEASPAPRMAELLAAAERVFLQQGYRTATMNDVAREAGMSKKTVYALIETKADLFAAVLAHHQSLVSFPVPAPDWSIADILTANLLCLARFMLAPTQIALVRLIMAEYAHSPDFGRVFMRSRVVKAKAKMEDCLASVARAQGVSEAQAKEMSAMLFGMALGEFHAGVLIGFRALPSKQVLEARVRRAVEIFLAGWHAGLDKSSLPSPTCGAPPPGD